MNIQYLNIRNFRNIGDEQARFGLNPHFTVIIGINGKGKSTILYALRVACGCFFSGIPDVKEKGLISPDEIRKRDIGRRLTPQKPVKIEAIGTFPDREGTLTWRRQVLNNSNTNTSSDADIGPIRNIARSKYELINQQGEEGVSLPVVAFFGTSRAHGAGRKLKEDESVGKEIFKDGYHSWYEMKSTTFKYESWLATYDILRRHGKEYENTKDAFFQAIKMANRYIEEIDQVNGKLWLKINMEGHVSDMLPMHLHSDGIRFYTEMVAELAYRCIVLNGYLDAAAIIQSTGVVMIDELDLHLHPSWQKVVVQDLKSAFPAIQFVVTTHSPFIVQSLETSELINLDQEQHSDVSPDELPLNKVVTEIMQVKNIRSDEFEKRYELAKRELEKLNKEPDKLTTDDYVEISKILGRMVENETNDPVLKAFLDKQNEDDSE